MNKAWPVMLVMAGLAACSGSKTACYALSDEDAANKVISEYGRTSAAERGVPAQMQFNVQRIVGVGRGPGRKGDAKALTQVWYSQDDHTLTVATITEDCAIQFRPGLAADAVKQAAIPTRPPNF
jgi:hypothetical protein